MELNITGRHGKLSPKVREYAEAKLEPVVRFDTRTRLIEVVLDHEPHRTTIEARAHVGKGAPIVVHASHETAEGAVDLVHDKLERAIRKHKERARDGVRHAPDAAQAVAGGPSDGALTVGTGEEE
ncbi:MAG: ribosome-associated translation inhibitor RaiA [Planctomycetes bacterium]|nr:ribosome-associated translation inhibitor RaiA [Planctomycetota bacterium]